MNNGRTKKMARVSRRAEERALPKTVWHPLSLQQLQTDQFVNIVNRILDGRTALCVGTLRGARAASEESSNPLAYQAVNQALELI